MRLGEVCGLRGLKLLSRLHHFLEIDVPFRQFSAELVELVGAKEDDGNTQRPVVDDVVLADRISENADRLAQGRVSGVHDPARA
jgi:hypothetical protein